jgi:hypothetical protein
MYEGLINPITRTRISGARAREREPLGDVYCRPVNSVVASSHARVARISGSELGLVEI